MCLCPCCHPTAPSRLAGLPLLSHRWHCFPSLWTRNSLSLIISKEGESQAKLWAKTMSSCQFWALFLIYECSGSDDIVKINFKTLGKHKELCKMHSVANFSSHSEASSIASSPWSHGRSEAMGGWAAVAAGLEPVLRLWPSGLPRYPYWLGPIWKLCPGKRGRL